MVSTTPANNATGVTLSKISSKASASGSGVKLNKTTGVTTGKIITATFSEAVNPLTINSATFTVTGPGVTPVSGLVAYAGPTLTATFIATDNLTPNTTYTGTITTGVKDVAGNAMVANYVWTFTTGALLDIIPPTVALTDPVNNAAGVALNKKIAVTFSEVMNPSSISTTTFTVQAGTTPVSGAVSYAGTTALFTPTNLLAPNTVFTATMSVGAKDLAGNPLVSNYVWSFTTGATPDVTPPTVVATTPVNNATGVPLTKVNLKNSAGTATVAGVSTSTGAAIGKLITATFSEAMDPLTITSSTFTVTGPGTAPVTGSVSYAGPSFTATFIAANSLTPSTTYTGTITTGSKDLAGNAMVSNYVWHSTRNLLQPSVRR